jgi:hypothetical protein
MAKLKGPLFSLGASGAIAKTLVYFPWKDLPVVREYVVPTNPRTARQNTQRGYLIAAVAKIHAVQADALSPLIETDIVAYALLGSIQATPRTWFNTICKQWLDQKVAGKIPVIWAAGSVTESDGALTFKLTDYAEAGAPASGKIWYGISKTALIHSVDCTTVGLIAGKEITGLTNKVKYYLQYRPLLPDTYIKSNSGIYTGIPKA